MNKKSKYERVGGIQIANDGKFEWLSAVNKNGIYRIDNDTHNVEFMGYFEESKIGEVLYYDIHAVGEKIIFVPHRTNKIGIYNKKENTMQYLELKQYDLNRYNENGHLLNTLCKSVRIGKYIYMLGYSYPVIIRLNVENLEIIYIESWINEINPYVKQGDRRGYFADGFLENKNKLYLPVACVNAILTLDLATLETQVIHIDGPFDGIGGITKIDDEKALLVGRGKNTNNVLIWNYTNNSVEKIVISDMENDKWDPFYAPISFGSKMILFPISAEHIYIVDLLNKTVCIYDELDRLMCVEEGEKIAAWKTMAPRLEGNTLKFITGYDFKWHEYNLMTKEYKSFYVLYEIVADEYLDEYYMEIINQIKKEKKVVNEKQIPLEWFIKKL